MAEALSESVHSIVFSATRPAIFSSRASYTSPMPPRATKRMIVKRPASTLPCTNAVGHGGEAAPPKCGEAAPPNGDAASADSGDAGGLDADSSRAAAATSPAHIEH